MFSDRVITYSYTLKGQNSWKNTLFLKTYFYICDMMNSRTFTIHFIKYHNEFFRQFQHIFFQFQYKNQIFLSKYKKLIKESIQDKILIN